MSLTVGKLLVSILEVEKQLTKAIVESKTVQFCINMLDLSEVFETIIPYFWYYIGSLKDKIRLEDGFHIMVILDIGVKMNEMTTEVMKDSNLAMR